MLRGLLWAIAIAALAGGPAYETRYDFTFR
jgi:hypothetical protein